MNQPDPVADAITCLIADDHEVVREGLRLALSRARNVRFVREATDGESACVLAPRPRPRRRTVDLGCQRAASDQAREAFGLSARPSAGLNRPAAGSTKNR